MNTQQNNPAANPALQGAMASAILSANKEAEQKAAAPKQNTPALGTAPAIVPRKDLLGNHILFLADEQDTEAGTIKYWDGKKGSKPSTAPIEFYRSTKPMDNEQDVQKLVQGYSKETNQKEFLLRKRLIKETVLNRDVQGKSEKTDIDAYKQKLIAALTKAIMES
jgi:hypothetical protein